MIYEEIFIRIYDWQLKPEPTNTSDPQAALLLTYSTAKLQRNAKTFSGKGLLLKEDSAKRAV